MIRLLWKSYRDLRWIVFAALLVILVPSVIDGWVNKRNSSRSTIEQIAPSGTAPRGEFRTDLPASLVVGFGGMLAILMAAVLTVGDLREPLFTFWRSRPIGAARFALVKYGAGLSALLVVFLVAMTFDLGCKTGLAEYRVAASSVLNSYNASLYATHVFTVVLVYSTAFALGCLLRNAVTTTLFSLAALLLIYFGPLVIPGLRPLDVFQWVNHQPIHVFIPQPNMYYGVDPGEFSFQFLSGRFVAQEGVVTFWGWSLLLSAVAAACGIIAVWRNIKWDAEQRGVCWSFGLAALLLFWGASTQIGSNLEPTRIVLPPTVSTTVERHPRFEGFHLSTGAVDDGGEGQVGFVLYRDANSMGHPLELAAFDPAREQPVSSSRFRVEDNAVGDEFYHARATPVAWHPAHPGIAYVFTEDGTTTTQLRIQDTIWQEKVYRRERLHLVTLDLFREPVDFVVHTEDLTRQIDINMGGSGTNYPGSTMTTFRPALPHLYATGNRLYLRVNDAKGYASVRLYDIADPRHPVYLETRSYLNFPQDPLPARGGDASRYQFLVSILPDATPRGSLEAAIVLSGRSHASLNGDILVVEDFHAKGSLEIYRLLGFDDDPGSTPQKPYVVARLERLGVYRASPLTPILAGWVVRMTLRDHTLALLTRGMTESVHVIDLRDPRRPVRAGHFVPSGNERLNTLTILPDGNLLAAGSKVYFLPTAGRGR